MYHIMIHVRTHTHIISNKKYQINKQTILPIYIFNINSQNKSTQFKQKMNQLHKANEKKNNFYTFNKILV